MREAFENEVSGTQLLNKMKPLNRNNDLQMKKSTIYTTFMLKDCQLCQKFLGLENIKKIVANNENL